MDTDKDNVLLALGQQIREKRQQARVSQEELAAKSGLDRTYISGVERGVRNPSFTAIWKVASGLDVSVSTLLIGVEDRLNGGDLNV